MKTKFGILMDEVGEDIAMQLLAAKVELHGADVAVKQLSECFSPSAVSPNAATVIGEAFVWDKTKEGHKYWEAIHQRLFYDGHKHTARSQAEERRWIVRCIAPTHYQMRPATILMGALPMRNGNRYIANSQVFETEEDAEKWLLSRLENLLLYERLDEEEYLGSHKQILDYGQVTYDGVSARILCIDANGEVVD